MAIKSTVYKLQLQIADMDRGYYNTHALTLACHPSETAQRMLHRVITFGLKATESLEFCKGISSDEEPDLWQKSLSDEIELWIDLGQPEEKRIRKACGRSKEVALFPYQPGSAKIWWEQNKSKFERFKNLSVILLTEAEKDQLPLLISRTMDLQMTVQDGQVWLTNGEHNICVDTDTLK